MDKEKSAVEDFLGEFGNKGEKKELFGENTSDPFAKQETEQQKPEEEIKEDKPLPFYKDPKIQKYIDKQVDKRWEEKQGVKSAPEEKPVEDTEVTDVLTRLIGNDTPEKVSMIREFKNILEKGTQRAKAEAIAELDLRQRASQLEEKEAEEELDRGFENIEETFDVDITSNNPIAKKTRQDFIGFIEKIAPKDKNGDIIDYPDMASSWETFSELRKANGTPSRAKDLASRGMSRSAETGTQKAIPANKYAFQRSDDFIESLSK